jgi:hypothetical protein
MTEGSSTSADARCPTCGVRMESAVERCSSCGSSKRSPAPWGPLLGIVAAGVGAYVLDRVANSSKQPRPQNVSEHSPSHSAQANRLPPETFKGMWRSKESLSSVSANEFFLQLEILRDGSFRGIWEPYMFLPVATGPFGMRIAGGWRSKASSPVIGEFDFTHSTGWILLDQRSSQELTIERQSGSEIRLRTTLSGDTKTFRSTILRSRE